MYPHVTRSCYLLPHSRLQSLRKTTNFAARFFRAGVLFLSDVLTHAQKKTGARRILVSEKQATRSAFCLLIAQLLGEAWPRWLLAGTSSTCTGGPPAACSGACALVGSPGTRSPKPQGPRPNNWRICDFVWAWEPSGRVHGAGAGARAPRR
jgi:hypothetical protein